jgi:hypothetical protein
MSIPRNLRYQGKIESAASRSSRVNISPQNGTSTYSLGDTIIVNLPSRNGLVLVPSESYLKFNLSVTNGDASANSYRFDSCGAHGLIRQIRVFSSSNMIQDIDTYSGLAKVLMDIQAPTSATYGKLNVLAATRADQVVTGFGSSAVVATAVDATNVLVNGVNFTQASGLLTPSAAQLVNVLNSLSVNQINAGDAHAIALAAAGTSTQQTYCLNLISLVGSLCQNNYLPLFASGSLRIEITLHDTLNKIFAIGNSSSNAVGAGTIAVTNCEYVANLIELSDSAMGMVNASLQGQPLQMVVPDWKNFQYSTPVSTGIQINVPIAAKFASLKSLITMSRDRYGLSAYYPQSSAANGLSQYFYRIGAVLAPSKPPQTVQECFSEVMKAIAGMSDLGHMPSIDKQSYQLPASTTQSLATLSNGATSSGSFYIGLDLEGYPNAQKDNIYAGYNTTSDDIFLTITYGTVANAVTTRFDTYALFDTLLVFENGVCYARY